MVADAGQDDIDALFDGDAAVDELSPEPKSEIAV
jgi:hypothetical protein